jgi:signal transduction histidine kinase
MVLARSQQATLRREPIDLAFAAQHAVDQSLAEAAARDVELRVDLQSAPIDGDRPLVERLVANLVENAVRHNVAGGIVRVTTRPGSIRVENTGRVIAPEDVRRLAEPFERLGRDSDGPGAGLGLSIVRAVADAHGAELDLGPRAAGGLDVRVTFAQSSPSGSAPARMRSTWTAVKGGEASVPSS